MFIKFPFEEGNGILSFGTQKVFINSTLYFMSLTIYQRIVSVTIYTYECDIIF